ncbi:MAG TPA: pitrilysin family protein [Thermoanaerobaculia bacterium]|jgi:predicted Zn-dependent peptidase|nr:pitrilysin family protein [Thermoanaerobaculia bacterium]
MRKSTRILLALLPLLAAMTAPLAAQKVDVVEKRLSNGMGLLIVRREGEATVAGGWVAHVGSSNERPGITGISHLFEHMMFKGTPTIGTKDYKQDLAIISEQEKVRDDIRQEEAKMRAAYRRGTIDDVAKPENKTPRLRELEKKFDELIAKQRQILVKNEFDRIYTTAGGSGMNAFTNEDMTGYFITVPSNKVELWMWMESERLLHPVFREFYAERDVVFEERRLRTEATPLGKYEETFESIFWESHPYNWPVVGWPSDIPAITKAQADAYYSTYYAPQNITLVLVGNLDPDEATATAERYFGRIPRGKNPVPDVVTLEVPQQAEKRLNAEAEANPQVDILWHTVPFGHADSYPLQVLAQLLSTRTGRLYKGLVLGSQVATDAFARQESRKWAGLFNAGGEAKEGRRPEEVEQAIYGEIAKLQKEDVPAEELEKVKNNFAAAEYRRLSSNFPILLQLIQNDGRGDWREVNEAGTKVQAVTAADVKRVASRYLTKENRAVATYTRKAGATGPEDPDLAGLDDRGKQMVRQLSQRLQTVDDPERLRQMLAQMESQPAGAPPEMKPALDVIRKKIQARIDELEKAKGKKG